MTEPLLGHAIVALVALQRVSELFINAANARRLEARGGIVVANDGMLGMVAFHSVWLATLASERLFLDARMFRPAIAWSVGFAVVLVEAMRVWVFATLGRRWTIRVVVLPGETPIVGGPYRFVRHPNYAVVIAELLLLPLLVGAWRTAIVGSLVNVPVLAYRIRREEAAWTRFGGGGLAPVPRFMPGRSPGGA